MTSQELDTRLEQLAIAGETADILAAIMLSEKVPSDRVAKIAQDWVNYARQKAKSPTALSEFERMTLIFAPRCKQVHNPLEIGVSAEQWAKNMARTAIEHLHEKNESMPMKIGTKVREIEVDENGELVLDTNSQKKYVLGYYHEGKYFEAPGKYGIVLGNPATVEAELKPFDGYEHNLNDLRIKSEIADEALSSAEYEHNPKPIEGYAPVDDIYVNPASTEPTKEFDYQYIEFLSELVYVQWYLADGTECEMGWHPSIALEELP
jgi:hypothetical protein